MVTEFGDYYDHITDALKILVIGGVVFYKIKSKTGEKEVLPTSVLESF